MNGNVNVLQALYANKISISNWLELMHKLPGDFQTMCGVAISYEKQKRFILQIGEHVASSDVTKLFSEIYQLIGEYKKIIRLNKPEGMPEAKFEKLMENLGQDITQNLSLWLTERGMLRDKTDLHNALYEKGLLPDYAKAAMTHADAFIYGRAYTSLAAALKNTQQLLKENFVKDTINKAGLTISFKEEDNTPTPITGKAGGIQR